MISTGAPLHFTVLTLFPELVQNYLSDALLAKALSVGRLSVTVISLRDFAEGKYKAVDDAPYGGGDGMVFTAGVLEKALLSTFARNSRYKKVIYLSPQGDLWNHECAKAVADDWTLPLKAGGEGGGEIILICGRYGGVDHRFIEKYVDQEISIGDYVLSGGELAALVLIESTSRFLPGVLGDAQSAQADSFENFWLEAPQFTKPQVWNEMTVPEVLTSGNHGKIVGWKENCAKLITLQKRPDLFQRQVLLGKVSMPQLKNFYDGLSADDKKVLGLENLNWEATPISANIGEKK